MKYAYSYDREDYTGVYNSPEAAFSDAVQNAEGVSSPPTTIYIGTIVEADAQTADHAERIIESMNRRAHVDVGDSGASYLKNVTPEQKADLDSAISAAIAAWLKKHNLMPTFVHIRSVREYPVDYSRTASARKSDATEVHDIGSDPSADLSGL